MAKDGEFEKRFDAYIERLAHIVGHADRRAPLAAYCQGLVLPGERKSIEPMAARVDPRHVQARHQSMHHFVAKANWSDQKLIREAREYALDAMASMGPLEAWIVDDTTFPKKGTHSVGVAHQYCGVLGKTANCQSAVSVSLANRSASVPAAYRLYLPDSWAKDVSQRKIAGIPEEVVFQKKWEIALDLLDRLVEEDVPMVPVLADAAYGSASEFREGLTLRGLTYAVGIEKGLLFWPNGREPVPAPRPQPGKHGRPPTKPKWDENHRPLSAQELALGLGRQGFQEVGWCEGTRGTLRSRFAARRVRLAKARNHHFEARAEEWLLIEWPEDEVEPTKYWLSTLGAEVQLKELVLTAKLRWRIERDYQELKDEIGLDHFEGRSWRGFHHHASLCIATYAFVVAERSRLSPPRPGVVFGFSKSALSKSRGGRRTTNTR